MLAHVRSFLQIPVLLAFALASSSSALAQTNGVPASVTSFGFGGKANPTPGVRASVTSLGPNGYGNNQAFWGSCCANFFMPANPNLSLLTNGTSRNRLSPERHRRRQTDRNTSVIGVYEPVYVPYPVAYADDSEDDIPDPSAEYVQGIGPRRPDAWRAANRDRASANPDAGDGEPAFGDPANGDRQASDTPPDPVVAQPTTTLVFKDGHKSDIENYAIVGDTLFDFSGGLTHKILLADLNLAATHKINDDRGVDFQVPANSKRQ